MLLNIFISSLCSYVMLVFFVFQLFPGSLNEKLKIKVMHKNAIDYSLISWANNYLVENDNILSFNRSISLYKGYSIFENLSWFIDFENKQSVQYLEYIKSKKINRLVFGGDQLNLGSLKIA